MGILRTTFAVAFTAYAGLTPAHASPTMFGDPLQFFATCTGRLSAELEFQWLIGDPDAAQTEVLRANMIDVLEALTPQDKAATVLNQRVAAKLAHSALLTTATFGTDDRLAASATQTAQRLRDGCTNALLS